jgi:uncharacterized lipoprotein YddW (UPF0748 family)
MRIICLFFIFLSLSIGLFAQAPATEVRAVWLATNWGLDWPTQGTSVTAQKEELERILDVLKRENFNTVLFQTRAQGRVFYKSEIEPKSSYFNHTDNFDPLAFVVGECHKRGLECHAWIATYTMGRAQMKYTGKGKSRKAIPVKNKPDYYKLIDETWHLDPGRPETTNLIVSVVSEIVSNYDVDGVHFDYIRYPSNTSKFPDEDTFAKYGNGEKLADWRRNNINRLVAKIYDTVKSIKRWVQVSSSPLGRYRVLPDSPNDGWTAYETVYQDAGQWMKSGKHDLIFPMMYYRGRNFYPFLNDWVANSNGRTVVPGLGVFQMNDLNWPLQDITDQMKYIRENKVKGKAYFRAGHLLSNLKGVMDSVRIYYRTPAKLPPLTWLDSIAPDSPPDLQVYKDNNGLLNIKWNMFDKNEDFTYTVYVSSTENIDRDNSNSILATGLHANSYSFPAAVGEFGVYYSVSASDRYHNESAVCPPAYFSHSVNEQ